MIKLKRVEVAEDDEDSEEEEKSAPDQESGISLEPLQICEDQPSSVSVPTLEPVIEEVRYLT